MPAARSVRHPRGERTRVTHASGGLSVPNPARGAGRGCWRGAWSHRWLPLLLNLVFPVFPMSSPRLDVVVWGGRELTGGSSEFSVASSTDLSSKKLPSRHRPDAAVTRLYGYKLGSVSSGYTKELSAPSEWKCPAALSFCCVVLEQAQHYRNTRITPTDTHRGHSSPAPFSGAHCRVISGSALTSCLADTPPSPTQPQPLSFKAGLLRLGTTNVWDQGFLMVGAGLLS